MAGNQRTVELVVKARDESQRVLNNAKTALDRFTAAQAKTAARRGFLAGQQAEAKRAYDAYGDAAAAVETLGRKLSAAKRPSAALREEFDRARTSARLAKQEFLAAGSAYAQSMGKAGGGRGSFAAMDDFALGRTESVVHSLAGAENRLAAATDRATGAAMRNAAATRTQGAAADLASRQAASWASRQGRGPLGLRPFELQNLSYQLNDVFTQIASGTPVMQVAAQQGGQFVQLFPKLGAAVLRLSPWIALATAAFAPFITAMNKANAEAKSLSEFDRLLTRSGEGASYTAQELANLAAHLDDYGASLKDARAALTEFVGDSVDPAYLERFGETAVDVSKVLGIDVTEAAKKVSDAFTGNADAVLALDDELNFLTDSERKHIEKLRESKKDAEARTTAFAIFERRYGETADKMRGPWSRILRDFGSAWGAFADTVNMIDFSEVGAKIDWLMDKIADLTASLPGARSANVENAEAWVDRAMAARNRAANDLADRRRRFGANDGRTRAAQREYDFQVAETNRAQTALTMAQFRDGTNPLQQRTASAPTDTTRDPPPAANSGRRSGASEAERRAKAQAEFLRDLEAENAARRFQLTLIDQEERERQVLEEIHEKERAARELGLELSADQRAEIRKTVQDLYDAAKANEAVRLIEDARRQIAEARGEVEDRDAFIQRKVEEAGLTRRELDDAGQLVVVLTQQGVEYQNVLRTLWEINEATRQRQVAEKQVNDLTSMRSDLLDRARFLQDTGRGVEADAVLAQIEALNAQIVVAADKAIAMWRVVGGPEAEAAIAVLQTARDEASGLGKDMVTSGRQINEMLVDGGMSGWDRFFQELEQGIGLFESLRNAFLAFASDFLRQIARMIAQQAILNLMRDAGMRADGSGGPAAAVAGWINGLVRHNGGMIGAGGGRAVPLAAVAGATRYHTGGVIGLKPNERAVVAEMGEEMLTADDPRHRNNLGKGAGGRNVKIVNVFDPVDLLDKALSSDGGERLFMNFVQRNAGAFKAAIG